MSDILKYSYLLKLMLNNYKIQFYHHEKYQVYLINQCKPKIYLILTL